MRKIVSLILCVLFLLPVYSQVGKVGINTNTPAAMLHVKDSSVLFTGMASLPAIPGATPVNGAGSRMMWYADKAAFRTGRVTDASWDKDSIGNYSFGAGQNVKAKGNFSTAFGNNVFAVGNSTIAIGFATQANGDFASALGYGTTANGNTSTALGRNSLAVGYASTSMGINTQASDSASTAMGSSTIASGLFSTAMGSGNKASGLASTAMGSFTDASGDFSSANGYYTNATGSAATAMGNLTTASGTSSTAMGISTDATATASTAMGSSTIASGDAATSMGFFTLASGVASTSLGRRTRASGVASIAMGDFTTASDSSTTAMGYNTTASGIYSTAMGSNTVASGSVSTSLGNSTEASGSHATAMGSTTVASGSVSTAMGNNTLASGFHSTALGSSTIARGTISTAIGNGTIARAYFSSSLGSYNDSIATSSPASWVASDPLFIIGNGTSNSTRSNALTILKNGNMGIGVIGPDEKLEVNGKTVTTNFQMTNGSAINTILQGNAGGNANWTNSPSITTLNSVNVNATNYNYLGPQTRYFNIPASGFQLMPVNGTSTAGLSSTTINGGQTLLTGTAGVASRFEAPIYLPENAEIKSILLYVRDASGSYEVSADLIEVTALTQTIVASVAGTGVTATPNDTNISATGLAIASNSTSAYFLRVNTIEFNGNLRVYNARITYTVSGPR